MILEFELLSAKVRKRKADAALALVGSVVDGHDEPLSSLPGKNQEAIVGPVAFPGGDAFEKLPSSVAHRRLPQHVQQPLVKLTDHLVDRLIRAATKVGGNTFLAPLVLSLMKEAQSRRQEGDDRSRLVDFDGSTVREPWLF